MRIEIKSRLDASVLFAHEAEGNTLKLTLEAAAKAGADLAGAYLAGANLADTDLAGAKLTRAYLGGAYLARAYLGGACLADAYLVGANLAGADLAGAYLARAKLAGANLADADLAGAKLAGAYLADANLAGADLAGADAVIDAGTPNGWRVVGWLREGYLSVRVGRLDKRLDEGREYWAGKDNRREVLAALDYVESIAKLRGWRVEA